jgi:transposase, IS6 family
MPESIQIRQIHYLNTTIEQDHGFLKKRVRSLLGFKTYETDFSGVESIHMIKTTSPTREVCIPSEVHPSTT